MEEMAMQARKGAILERDDYSGIPVRFMEIVTDEDLIRQRAERLLQQVVQATEVNGPIRQRDEVEFSYVIHVGGKLLAKGGRGACTVVVGSGMLIDGLEEKLLAHCVGDSFEFKLNFPVSHINEALCGRLGLFSVKVLSVRRMPNHLLEDEIVRSVSEFDSVSSFLEALREQIETENAEEMARFVRNSIDDALVERSKIVLDDGRIDERVDQILSRLRSEFDEQGISLENYLLKEDLNAREFETRIRAQASRELIVSETLALVAEREHIVATQEEREEELTRLSQLIACSVDEVEERVADSSHLEILLAPLIREKTYQWLFDHAEIVCEGQDGSGSDERWTS